MDLEGNNLPFNFGASNGHLILDSILIEYRSNEGGFKPHLLKLTQKEIRYGIKNLKLIAVFSVYIKVKQFTTGCCCWFLYAVGNYGLINCTFKSWYYSASYYSWCGSAGTKWEWKCGVFTFHRWTWNRIYLSIGNRQEEQYFLGGSPGSNLNIIQKYFPTFLQVNQE